MNKENWSKGIRPGSIVRLRMKDTPLPSNESEDDVDFHLVIFDTEDVGVDNYIVGTYNDGLYSLVSITRGDTIAVAGTIEDLIDVAQINYHSDIELVNKWFDLNCFLSNFYGIDI